MWINDGDWWWPVMCRLQFNFGSWFIVDRKDDSGRRGSHFVPAERITTANYTWPFVILFPLAHVYATRCCFSFRSIGLAVPLSLFVKLPPKIPKVFVLMDVVFFFFRGNSKLRTCFLMFRIVCRRGCCSYFPSRCCRATKGSAALGKRTRRWTQQNWFVRSFFFFWNIVICLTAVCFVFKKKKRRATIYRQRTLETNKLRCWLQLQILKRDVWRFIEKTIRKRRR